MHPNEEAAVALYRFASDQAAIVLDAHREDSRELREDAGRLSRLGIALVAPGLVLAVGAERASLIDPGWPFTALVLAAMVAAVGGLAQLSFVGMGAGWLGFGGAARLHTVIDDAFAEGSSEASLRASYLRGAAARASRETSALVTAMRRRNMGAGLLVGALLLLLAAILISVGGAF